MKNVLVFNKAIAATVIRKMRNRPKEYVFLTTIQSEAEAEMTRLGYGCGQYTLAFVYTQKEIS